jgi:acyl-CoA dehydrogenase
MSSPIAITVEGANILTRSMIIFGNGVFRCHPYIYKEMRAILSNDLTAFDWAFWRHVMFAITTAIRVPLLSITGGWLSPQGFGFDNMAKYRRRLLRASAAFTLHTEIFLAAYTGSLKFKEMLTGRMADILANMYFALCVMRRFEAQGRAKEFKPFAVWALDHCFAEISKASENIARNIETPVLGHFFRWIVLPWTRLTNSAHATSDAMARKIAKALQTPGAVRDELTRGIFVPQNRSEPLSELDSAMNLAQATKQSQFKVRKAITEKRIKKGSEEDVLGQAVSQGILTENEAKIHREAARMAKRVIEVDAFAAKDFLKREQEQTPAI